MKAGNFSAIIPFRVSLACLCGAGSLWIAPGAWAASLCPATGHYYDFVSTYCNQPWAEARGQAVAAGGYLATVTSADEQLCMSTIQGGTWAAWWSGGSDAAVEGEWRWVTGPEATESGGAGRQYWQGGPTQFGGTTTAPDHYANWFPPPAFAEPNNSGNEDYMSFNTGGGIGGANNYWNDVGSANSAVCGYAVEFDSDPSGPSDPDGDGVPDDSDNCPDDPNPAQEDNDGDGDGDVCDADDDNDGVADLDDNCPTDANPLQEDIDLDGLGNACDGSFGGDAVTLQIEGLVIEMRAIILAVDPPGGNGMIAKLTGKGGVLAKVGNALTTFGLGLIDTETYIAELGDALDKLTSFDNQLAAKIGNGQIPAVEGDELIALSAEIRAIIESLINAVTA